MPRTPPHTAARLRDLIRTAPVRGPAGVAFIDGLDARVLEMLLDDRDALAELEDRIALRTLRSVPVLETGDPR